MNANESVIRHCARTLELERLRRYIIDAETEDELQCGDWRDFVIHTVEHGYRGWGEATLEVCLDYLLPTIDDKPDEDMREHHAATLSDMLRKEEDDANDMV